jgi:hypothetical protein
MIWHKRRTYDPVHCWMRTMIRTITEPKRRTTTIRNAAGRRIEHHRGK